MLSLSRALSPHPHLDFGPSRSLGVESCCSLISYLHLHLPVGSGHTPKQSSKAPEMPQTLGSQASILSKHSTESKHK